VEVGNVTDCALGICNGTGLIPAYGEDGRCPCGQSPSPLTSSEALIDAVVEADGCDARRDAQRLLNQYFNGGSR
jgi:hypothetical protein